jgi:hypothetical protein
MMGSAINRDVSLNLAPLAGRGRREAPGEGDLLSSLSVVFADRGTSPQPSPRKSGERGRTGNEEMII